MQGWTYNVNDTIFIVMYSLHEGHTGHDTVHDIGCGVRGQGE